MIVITRRFLSRHTCTLLVTGFSILTRAMIRTWMMDQQGKDTRQKWWQYWRWWQIAIANALENPSNCGKWLWLFPMERKRNKENQSSLNQLWKDEEGQYINFGSTTVAKKFTSLSLKNNSSLSLINFRWSNPATLERNWKVVHYKLKQIWLI